MTISRELLDELLSGVERPEDLLGDKGLMKELKVRLMERMLGAELTGHLVHELMEARDERRLLRLQKQMANCKLLIIDELGFVPLSKTGAEVLFELISQRYERGATLIASNLPFDEWTETFGSERLTGALLDRLTHHVNILEMNGDSYRLAQSRGRKGIAINQGQDRLALAGQSAQAPASYIESAGTWAPSAFLVPDSGTLKWPTFAPPHGRFLLRR